MSNAALWITSSAPPEERQQFSAMSAKRGAHPDRCAKCMHGERAVVDVRSGFK